MKSFPNTVRSNYFFLFWTVNFDQIGNHRFGNDHYPYEIISQNNQIKPFYSLLDRKTLIRLQTSVLEMSPSILKKSENVSFQV